MPITLLLGAGSRLLWIKLFPTYSLMRSSIRALELEFRWVMLLLWPVCFTPPVEITHAHALRAPGQHTVQSKFSFPTRIFALQPQAIQITALIQPFCICCSIMASTVTLVLLWQWKRDTDMWSTRVLNLVAIWTIDWFVLVSSHQWLPELLCFPANSRRKCWAFQFRIDVSNACIYESGFWSHTQLSNNSSLKKVFWMRA